MVGLLRPAHNLHGYICLKFSVLWGVAGALIVRYITPFTHGLFSRIPTPLGWILLAVLGGLLLADFLVTAIGLVGLNRKLKNLQYVTGKLRQGSDKLGADLSKSAIAFDDRRKHLRQTLEKDWQREAARLKVKYEKDLQNNILRRRLLKAFPDLKMLEYNVQLEELRQNVDVLRRRSWEALRKRNEDARAAYETRLAPGEEQPFAFGLCYDKLFWIFMTGNVVGFVLETVYIILRITGLRCGQPGVRPLHPGVRPGGGAHHPAAVPDVQPKGHHDLFGQYVHWRRL